MSKRPSLGEQFAVLNTEFKDHKANEEKWQEKIEKKMEGLDNKQSKLLNIFTKGEGKIANLRDDVQEQKQALESCKNSHKEDLRDRKDWSLRTTAIVLAIITLLINVASIYIQNHGGG